MSAGIFKPNVSRSVFGNVMVFLFLLVFGVFFAFPIVYAIITAFKPMNEILIFPPRFFVRHPTLDNFIELSYMADSFGVPLIRYIFNSVLVSVLGTVGHLLLSSMAAYPLARHPFPGHRWIKQIVVLSLLFTASVTYLPQYVVMSQLKLINTYGALILPALQSSLGLYLMMNFMGTLPEEMLEAARIDGAREATIYWRIVMPNVKPAWLTLIIFSFQGLWNSTGGSLVYSEELKVLPAVMAQITAGGIARAGVSSAAALIMMLPPVLIFILSQKSVIQTMSTSGLK